MKNRVVTPRSQEGDDAPVALSPAPVGLRGAEVRRQGVLERLERAATVDLVLVCAPAGFGKTTAMTQWRAQLEVRGVPTAWCTLTRADNDVPHFLASLGTALAPLDLAHRPAGSVSPAELLTSASGPFVLFLDEAEVIQAEAVLGLLREIVEHLPRDGQLVIGSRRQLALGLGRWRARGQLLEVGAEALRFTSAEASEFFQLRGTPLSPETLEQACARTEGWAAALWLLALALQPERDGTEPRALVQRLTGTDRDVADYLTEEVLAQQPPQVRQFLLRTSVLRQVCAGACEALMPGTDCVAMLQALEQANVFLTPVAGQPGAYRYHSLFVDFLRDQLEREQPEQVTRLHLAASGWYEAQGWHVSAIDHAIEGGDYPHALALLQHQAERLLQQGRMRLLDRWFSVIPPALLRQQPLLQVVAAWARCFIQGPWRARAWLESTPGCLDSDDPLVQAHVRALWPVMLAMMDQYDAAHAAGVAGVARLPSGHAFTDSVLLNAMAHIVSVAGERKAAHQFLEHARRAQGDSAFNRMYTETVAGLLDLREGRLRQATARFRMAVAASEQRSGYSYTHGNAWAGVFLASVLYEANDIQATERLLNVYVPLARDVGLPDHLITSHRIRARIAFERGEVDTAFGVLTELEYLGYERQLPRVSANAKLERARILLLQGNELAAREELARADDGSWETVQREQRAAQDVEDLFIGQQRLRLHCGHAAEAVAPLQAALADALMTERRHRALKLRLLLAVALYRSGEVGRGLDELALVLHDAAREGFLRLILDEGPAVAPLLRHIIAHAQALQAARDPIFDDYLHRLAALLGADTGIEDDAPPAPATEQPAEPLTRREIRVLQLLAEGYSNTAMAEKLFVSDSTVRTHLRNINAKLGSRNRTQAVALARRSGLIR